MQYAIFISSLLLTGTFAAQDFANVRAKDVIDLEYTLSSIPQTMMDKIKSLPESMMNHQIKTMSFIGISEIAAGAAMMHRGMDLLRFEVAMYHDLHANSTMIHDPPRLEMPGNTPPPSHEVGEPRPDGPEITMPKFEADETSPPLPNATEDVDDKPEVEEAGEFMTKTKRYAAVDEEDEEEVPVA